MSGFVANGNAEPAAAAIASIPFWPSVDPAAVRAQMRIDTSVQIDRLRAAIVAAILAVNDELDEWRAQQEAAGVATLVEVPAPSVDGRSRLVVLYLRAVAVATAAEVAERYRTYDATDSGATKADALTPTIDDLRRDLRWAIRDFLGQRRMTVELI